MPDDENLTIGIIGAGAMGRGITQVAVTGGCRVKLFDTKAAALSDAVSFIGQMLNRAVEKNRMQPADAKTAAAKLQTTSTMKDFADCQVVIEAAVENLDIKRSIFAELECIVGADVILASNTSSLSITTLAASCNHPERIAGMHFFNPVPLMKLVEVINGLRTASHVTEFLMGLGKRMGREPVRVKDAPGFLVNQVGRGYNIEAAHLCSEGVAEYSDVDRIMRDAAGFRMGPFELMDLTALDVTHPATDLIYQQFYHEPRYRPSVLMNTRLEAGLLGRKSGQGFYTYEDGTAQITEEHPAPAYDRRALWVSRAQPSHHSQIVGVLNATGAAVDEGETPADTSLCVVAPLGLDATTACVNEGLDPERTVAIDCLFGLTGRRTLIKTPVTKTDYAASAHGAFALDGTPVSIVRDSAGFVTQRILAMIVNIGCSIAQSGIATPEDIDRAVIMGLGYPLGPLAFGDKLGAGRIFETLENLSAVTRDPRYRPTPWLRRRAMLGVSLLTPET